MGPAPAAQAALGMDRIVAAAKRTGAEAVHPGFGFLSENPKFVEALDAAGIVFIGPPVKAMAAMGDKITSKKLAAAAGVSTVRSEEHTSELQSLMRISYAVFRLKKNRTQYLRLYK